MDEIGFIYKRQIRLQQDFKVVWKHPNELPTFSTHKVWYFSTCYVSATDYLMLNIRLSFSNRYLGNWRYANIFDVDISGARMATRVLRDAEDSSEGADDVYGDFAWSQHRNIAKF